MKTKNITNIVLTSGLLILTSCSTDFLDVPVQGAGTTATDPRCV